MIFSEKSETPNLTDYLKAKPDSVVYYGDKKSTASWQLLYFIALKLIAAKHPDELMRLERKSILGDKIEIGSEIEIREFSHPLGIMRKPDGKWLFAETDFNVQQILLHLKKLMEICKDPLDTMVIYFSANQSQNVSLRTDKSDSPLIRKSLAEIFRPKVPKATPTVTTAEQQYVQWLIQKGEKPSEAQAAFSMTEKVINRLQISAKRLFSVTSAVELKYILSALRRTPQWHYFSSRQQNQIVHTIDLYREFRESSAKALANAQAASTVQPPATTSTSHPSVLPAPALSGSQKISSPEKFSCAGAIADCIGAKPEEIYFTSGGTESDNWAIKSSSLKRPILTSQIEHHAILNACAAMEHLGVNVRYLPVNCHGTVQTETLEAAMDCKPRLVSIMLVNNEIGSIEPIASLANIAHKYGALFHTDAVQAVGHIPIDVNSLGIDMLSASAHKFNGPKGIGFIFIKSGTSHHPFMDGGAQESGMRAGTENVASIVGMATALKKNCHEMKQNQENLLQIEQKFLNVLSNSKLDFVRNGDVDHIPGNVSISFRNASGEMLLHRLDLMGICISTGSACDSKSIQTSHVLKAIHLSDEYARGTIRVSFGKQNTLDEATTIANAIIKILNSRTV